jgi:hypothetical protein
MALFKDAENGMAKAKIGFMGETGTGKTYTATLTAIGLLKFLRERDDPAAARPAYFLDTEQGSSWIKPQFEKEGFKLRVAKTRAFAQLVPAVQEAQKEGSILLIDSVTHFWQNIQADYMEKKKRTRLEFQDWAWLKLQWGKFTDAFVSSDLHIIVCGRLGFEYDQVENERGKKEIQKSGVKMAAEKGMGYEPNMLVWMEKDMDLQTKLVTRTAIILKDRSTLLDGKQFDNPTFETFKPHFMFLDLNAKHDAVDTDDNSLGMIPDDEFVPHGERRAVQREIVVDEIQALMLKHYPSTSAADKKAKGALLEEHFKTTSWTEVEKVMSLVTLQACYDSMHRDLEKTPSRYGVAAAKEEADRSSLAADEIPEFPGDRPLPEAAE